MQARRPEVSAATPRRSWTARTAKDLARALPGRGEHGRRPRGGARDRGVALGAGDRRGDDRAADAAGRSSRRRLPWRMRHPARWVASLALVGAIVAIVLVLAARTDAPRRVDRRRVRRRHGLQPVQLSQTAAHDYNPFGTGPENRDQVGERRRQRPEHDLEHRALLRRDAAEGRRRRASGSISTRRPACAARGGRRS